MPGPSSRKSELANQLSSSARESAEATLLFHQSVATRLGLHPTDLKCAGIVAKAGVISAGELAARCGLTTGAATTMLDRLESRGLVQRERDSGDRRRVLVQSAPNPEQIAEITALFKPLEAGMIQICAEYTEAELETVLRFISRVQWLVEQETERLNKRDA